MHILFFLCFYICTIFCLKGQDAEELSIQDLDSLFKLSLKQGNKDQALIYAHKSLEKAKLNSKTDTTYGNSLNNLGRLYGTMGSYEEAESYLLKSLKIREKIFGKAHPDFNRFRTFV